jgi:hypothetical protein
MENHQRNAENWLNFHSLFQYYNGVETLELRNKKQSTQDTLREKNEREWKFCFAYGHIKIVMWMLLKAAKHAQRYFCGKYPHKNEKLFPHKVSLSFSSSRLLCLKTFNSMFSRVCWRKQWDNRKQKTEMGGANGISQPTKQPSEKARLVMKRTYN